MMDEIQTMLDGMVRSILGDLVNPWNADLVKAVREFDEDGGFMFGFSTVHHKPMGFEEFANAMRGIDGLIEHLNAEFDPDNPAYIETINMSKAYDEYLEKHETAIDSSPINDSQAKRWDAIVAKYDDGITGSMYGYVCRKVQWHLLMFFN